MSTSPDALFRKRCEIWDFANYHNLTFGQAFVDFYDESLLGFNEVATMPLGLEQLCEIKTYLMVVKKAYGEAHEIEEIIDSRIEQRKRTLKSRERRARRKRTYGEGK
ncbi:hypothetical protein IT397_03245 [Candidatus Nomurabacteria bacterium]|nr:hypothetical protein [Candidatus Nomurabacteria bacterium]